MRWLLLVIPTGVARLLGSTLLPVGLMVMFTAWDVSVATAGAGFIGVGCWLLLTDGGFVD